MDFSSLFSSSPPKKKYNTYQTSTEYNFSMCKNGVTCSKESGLEEQWCEVLSHWGEVVSCIPEKTRELVRRGIPASVRGGAWKMITGAVFLEIKNPGVYELLLSQKSESEDCLKKDVNRTFPKHKHFKQKDGAGQIALFNVLKAYSNMDPELGYCQGMSFITAILVAHMEEKEAFWVLVQIIKTYSLGGLFRPGLPLLRRYLYRFARLVQAFFPELQKHFAAKGVKSLLYSSEWFSTIFSYNFPLSLSSRIWDVYFVEGNEYLFKVGLAILRQFQEQLLKMDFEEIIIFLKDCGYKLDYSIVTEADEFDIAKHLQLYDSELDRDVEGCFSRYCI